MRIAGQLENLSSTLQSLINEPSSQAWNRNLRPQGGYLIDPVLVSTRYGNDLHQQIVLLSALLEQYGDAQPVNRFAAGLDMLARQSLDQSSNISGIGSPESSYYPIAPNIHYSRQYKPVSGRNTKDNVTTAGKMVEFINLTDIPMMDWDIPGPSHQGPSVTVRNLGDVEELIRDHLARNPESALRLYQTPGGFRAWEIARRMNPLEFKGDAKALKVDPMYRGLALMSGSVNHPMRKDGRNPLKMALTEHGLFHNPFLSEALHRQDAVKLDPPGFRSRISAKPALTKSGYREGDYAAQPLMTFTGRDAITDADSVDIIRTMHDDPIEKAYLGPTGVNPEAFQQLAPQLKTASRGTAQKILDTLEHKANTLARLRRR